jgi:hypothetical protein
MFPDIFAFSCPRLALDMIDALIFISFVILSVANCSKTNSQIY